MKDTSKYDAKLRKLAREVVDPELRDALMDLANARDGLNASMHTFETLCNAIENFDLPGDAKELFKSTVSDAMLKQEGNTKAVVYTLYASFADTKNLGDVAKQIMADAKSLSNHAYEFATRAYTDFVDYATDAYNGIKDAVGGAASGVANVVNDALIEGARKVTEVQLKAKETVDKGIDALTQVKDTVISYTKNKASDAKNALITAGQSIIKVGVNMTEHKQNQLDGLHKICQKAENFFRSHATGILMSSEIIREGRNAAAAEMEKAQIEKKFECSETNRHWCKALLKECSLHPDRTKEENVHAVNENFAQMKEVAIANLAKSGQNGPGMIANIVAKGFDKIADSFTEAKSKLEEQHKDVASMKEQMEKKIDDLEEQRV